MITRAYLLIKYLCRKFIFKGKSTFLIDWKENSIDYKNVAQKIEDLQNSLLKNKQLIKNADFGAGKSKKELISISKITKNASSAKTDRKILFYIIKKYKTKSILELGTSMGLSTMAMALANPESKIITIEGNPEILEKAQGNFKSFGLKNISAICGKFDELLPNILTQLQYPFLIFIDGNHTYEATKKYYSEINPFLKSGCILVFHDINWSAGMQKAWDEIKNSPGLKVEFENFRLGAIIAD